MRKDLDKVIDPRPHDRRNRSISDDELLASYKSRKRRKKPTWQMERELERRGLI